MQVRNMRTQKCFTLDLDITPRVQSSILKDIVSILHLHVLVSITAHETCGYQSSSTCFHSKRTFKGLYVDFADCRFLQLLLLFFFQQSFYFLLSRSNGFSIEYKCDLYSVACVCFCTVEYKLLVRDDTVDTFDIMMPALDFSQISFAARQRQNDLICLTGTVYNLRTPIVPT